MHHKLSANQQHWEIMGNQQMSRDAIGPDRPSVAALYATQDSHTTPSIFSPDIIVMVSAKVG